MPTTNKKRVHSTTSRPTSTTNGFNRITGTVRGASSGRRFGPNLGEAIILALALGAAVRTIGRGTP